MKSRLYRSPSIPGDVTIFVPSIEDVEIVWPEYFILRYIINDELREYIYWPTGTEVKK